MYSSMLIYTTVCILAVGIPFAVSKSFASIEKMVSGLERFQESYPLPKLPYKYDAFEPWIDEATMKAHHSEVHADRTLKMNQQLQEWRKSGENPALAKSSILEIIKNIHQVPELWREPLRNSIGGYLNHIFYFATLSPNPEGKERKLSSSLSYAINYSFVNFTNFQKTFNKAATDVFSTGYVWLVRIPRYRYLTTYVGLQEANPWSVNYQPILGLDLWEHTFFTKYGKDRDEYIRNWWKLVDFDKVEEVLNWWWSFDPKHDEL